MPSAERGSGGRASSARARAEARGALRLEVFQHLFAALAEEMGARLMRSAFSANIKERRDFSCALFDASGRMLSQAAHIPIHLGSAPLCVQAALAALPLEPGDAVVLNDPFAGGTHLPDVTLVTPLGAPRAGRARFYAANRAHHADVGGAAPGSMAPAFDIHGEGLRIPPTKLVRRGALDRGVLALLLANMRVPAEREGDLLAQWAANRLAVRRFAELEREHGSAALAEHGRGLLAWSAELARRMLRALPSGRYEAAEELETCGATLRLALTLGAGRATFDFRASDDQVDGPINTTRAVAVSAVFYVLRLLLPAGAPTNDGVLEPVEILTRPGSLVDARYPAAVCAGNVETSQRLVDCLLAALAQAAPERVPAASAGTMSNVTIGGARPDGRAFTHYETIAGGAGGGPAGPGAHAVQTHMTNTRNTPIEALESELPVRVTRYTVRRGSGGRGARAGGDGIVKHFRFLVPARLAWVAERQRAGPQGLAGGGPGRAGSARIAARRGSSALAPPAALSIGAEGELWIETPGGGGHGRAPRKPL